MYSYITFQVTIYNQGEFMKKSFFIVLVLAIFSTPFVVLSIIGLMQIKPETQQFVPPTSNITSVELEPLKPLEPTAELQQIPSKSFMSGYWDGWHGVWLGPIRWTVSDDYRQGHMLGSYDRRNKTSRYPPPK